MDQEAQHNPSATQRARKEYKLRCALKKDPVLFFPKKKSSAKKTLHTAADKYTARRGKESRLRNQTTTH